MNPEKRLAINYLKARFKLLSYISKKKAAQKAFALFCTPQTRNKIRHPPIFEGAENVTFPFEGINIIGYRWNYPAKNKILILHGFESTVLNFDQYIGPFIHKGYEVLAFDAPANGRSGGKMINALIYKRFIIELCKRFGPVQSFLAHSFGGLALCLALEDIKHDDTFKVVLIAPATDSTSAITAFFNFLQLNDQVKKEFENLVLLAGQNPSAWYSIYRAVKNIKAKILWFHDEDDVTTPFVDAMKVKEQNHPHIKFVITKGLGHSRIYRDDAVRQQVIQFV